MNEQTPNVKRRVATATASALALVAIASALMASSCGQNDVKVQSRDKSGARVLNMPDHFSSVAVKCDGLGHRVYEGDHGNSDKGGGYLVVINDEKCNHVGP